MVNHIGLYIKIILAARMVHADLFKTKKIKKDSHRFYYTRKDRVYWCNKRDWHLIRFLLIYWSWVWKEVSTNLCLYHYSLRCSFPAWRLPFYLAM